MANVPLKRQTYPTKRSILTKRDVRARQDYQRQQRELEKQRVEQQNIEELYRQAREKGGIVYKGKIILIPQQALTSKESFRQFRASLSDSFKRAFGRTPTSSEISEIQNIGLSAYPRRTMATPTTPTSDRTYLVGGEDPATQTSTFKEVSKIEYLKAGGQVPEAISEKTKLKLLPSEIQEVKTGAEAPTIDLIPISDRGLLEIKKEGFVEDVINAFDTFETRVSEKVTQKILPDEATSRVQFKKTIGTSLPIQYFDILEKAGMGAGKLIAETISGKKVTEEKIKEIPTFTGVMEELSVGMIGGVREKPVTAGAFYLVGGIAGKGISTVSPYLARLSPMAQTGAKAVGTIAGTGLTVLYGGDVLERVSAKPTWREQVKESGKILSTEIIPMEIGFRGLLGRARPTESFKVETSKTKLREPQPYYRDSGKFNLVEPSKPYQTSKTSKLFKDLGINEIKGDALIDIRTSKVISRTDYESLSKILTNPTARANLFKNIKLISTQGYKKEAKQIKGLLRAYETKPDFKLMYKQPSTKYDITKAVTSGTKALESKPTPELFIKFESRTSKLFKDLGIKPIQETGIPKQLSKLDTVTKGSESWLVPKSTPAKSTTKSKPIVELFTKVESRRTSLFKDLGIKPIEKTDIPKQLSKLDTVTKGSESWLVPKEKGFILLKPSKPYQPKTTIKPEPKIKTVSDIIKPEKVSGKPTTSGGQQFITEQKSLTREELFKELKIKDVGNKLEVVFKKKPSTTFKPTFEQSIQPVKKVAHGYRPASSVKELSTVVSLARPYPIFDFTKALDTKSATVQDTKQSTKLIEGQQKDYTFKSKKVSPIRITEPIIEEEQIVDQEQRQQRDFVQQKRPIREPLFLPQQERKRLLLEKKKEARAYQLYVKQKGKFVKTGRPTTRQSALDYGSEIVDKTPSAHFKIVPSKKNPQSVPRQAGYFNFNMFKFRPYKIRKGRKVPMTEQFIEKRRFRIDSAGEKRGITTKGLTAIKRKSILGSMPKLNIKRLI